LNYDNESEEVQAGCDVFTKYGDFGTIYGLCGGDPFKFDEIQLISYNRIYNIQRYRLELRNYEKRLNKIYQDKHK
jgi:hypothetical protein